MRTKALIMSAAALAVGIATSNAQVYSQNIVGYTSIPATASTYSILGVPLDADGTGTNNTLATVFTSPNTNDTVLVYNGSGYNQYIYKVVSSGHGTSETYATNWYSGLSPAATTSLNPGVGFWYSAGKNETNVIVGQVLQGTNLVNSGFPPANTYAMLSSVAPESGGITSVLGYHPTTNDTVLEYNGSGYNQYVYKVVSSGHGTSETYSTNWYSGLSLSEPVISVGQGFWFLAGNENTNWSENFVVNP